MLTIDGLGDGLSATISTFRDGRLERVAASPARNSLGVFFEHVTNLLNMRELEDEGKVMALADYAAPIADADNPLLPWVRVRDGVIETAWPGHAFRRPLARVHWRFPNEQFAYLAQRVVEHAAVALARDAVRLTGLRRLALAGGVVSNVKATRRVRLLPEVEDVFVFPAHGRWRPGARRRRRCGRRRLARRLASISIVSISDRPTIASVIESSLRAAGLPPTCVGNLPCRVAELLADGRIVMWFQGAMEYGPRALGHRSVLARPDRLDLRDRLNLVLKRRVWYQPFCPSMLESEAARLLADWTGGRNRAMTMAYEVAERVPRASGRRDERRRHVPAADSSPTRRADRSRNCCARRGGAGTSAPCSTRASTSTASRWCVRRAKRSTCSCAPAPTRWRSARSSSSVPHDARRSRLPHRRRARWLAVGLRRAGWRRRACSSGCSGTSPGTCASS